MRLDKSRTLVFRYLKQECYKKNRLLLSKPKKFKHKDKIITADKEILAA